MIVFISAADTELLSLEGAIRQLPAAFPAVRAFLSTRLQTDEDLDAMLADVGAEARIFVVRVLGGRSFSSAASSGCTSFAEADNGCCSLSPGTNTRTRSSHRSQTCRSPI